jgi:hypothetical protein
VSALTLRAGQSISLLRLSSTNQCGFHEYRNHHQVGSGKEWPSDDPIVETFTVRLNEREAKDLGEEITVIDLGKLLVEYWRFTLKL